MLEDSLELQDILDLEVWQKIQDSYAEATGFAAIIVDRNGTPLLDYSNFSDYCIEVRKTKNCEYCFLSDASAGDIAFKNNKPVIYRCHAGLIDFAVPILIQGKYMGAILSGQARIKDEDLKSLDYETILDTNPKGKPIYESNENFKKLYEKTPILEFDRVKAASELLFTIATHLGEMRMINQVQKELHDKEFELSEETRLRSQIEASLREADLKALESQINPHFLFNVLNTIGRLALLEGAQKTQEIVYQFADLMRYSLQSNKMQAVIIQDELEYVKNYLSIQKIRLSDRLEFNIKADQNILDCICPSMIIQPFVENVINHVIEPRTEGGLINISVRQEKEDVVFCIEDNGNGISQDKADEILSGTYQPEGNSTGIGIFNVNKRLKYYYGAQNGVHISPSSLGGTKIEMRIPKTSRSSEE